MNKSKQRTKNVREAALEILESIDKQQSYSNLLLNQVINKNRFSASDTGLLTELVYGTIQRKMTLDYYLRPFLKKDPEHWVLILLRVALYQMVYLERVPERAAIHEAVEIAKRQGHKGISGFVNGVLRSIQRTGVQSLESISDPIERLSVETSHPEWLVKRWEKQFGLEKTRAICEENLLAPVQTARVNQVVANCDEVIEKLATEGFETEPSPVIPSAIRAKRGNLAQSAAYAEGLLTIQDESSMAVGYALQVEDGFDVLDMCAAPGGKTTHIAELLNNTGKVTALDLHPHKVKLIADNAARLGLHNVETEAMDSRKAEERFSGQLFDRVLVDAPCSGFGVMRRKPDIKYTKTEADITSLSAIQMDILTTAAPLVKSGGVLVYSTCTINVEENEAIVQRFLQQHPDFEPEPLQMPKSLTPLVTGHTLQIFPQDFGGDGFFISSFRKKVNEWNK